jgi:hypothetical protein
MADFHRPMAASYEATLVLRKPTPEIVMMCFDA